MFIQVQSINFKAILAGIIFFAMTLISFGTAVTASADHHNLGLGAICHDIEDVEEYRGVPKDLSNDCSFVFKNKMEIRRALRRAFRTAERQKMRGLNEASVYNNLYWEIYNIFNVKYPGSA